jgi:SecD/SecF fusion protein
MNRTDQWKLLGVVLVTALALWKLYPSYRYYTLTPEQRTKLPVQELADLRKNAIHLGLDLQGGMHLVLEVDRSRLNPAEAKDATDRAMEIIRNRVDQFGVAEPLIQREGDDRIAIQLPGLTDRQRAIELIGKTAL